MSELFLSLAFGIEFFNMTLVRYALISVSLIFLLVSIKQGLLNVFYKLLCKINLHHIRNIPYLTLSFCFLGPTILVQGPLIMNRLNDIFSYNMGCIFSSFILVPLIKFTEYVVIRKAYREHSFTMNHLIPSSIYIFKNINRVGFIYAIASNMLQCDIVFQRISLVTIYETFSFDFSVSILLSIFLLLTGIISWSIKLNSKVFLPFLFSIFLLSLINFDKSALKQLFTYKGSFNVKEFIIGITIVYQIIDIFCYITTMISKYYREEVKDDSDLSLVTASFIPSFIAYISFLVVSSRALQQVKVNSSIFCMHRDIFPLHIFTCFMCVVLVFNIHYVILQMLKQTLSIFNKRKLLYSLCIVAQIFFINNAPPMIVLDLCYGFFGCIQVSLGIISIFALIKSNAIKDISTNNLNISKSKDKK